MKHLSYILLFFILLSACKKDNSNLIPTPITPEPTEDSTIVIPPFSATMTSSGSTRTINIVGGLTYISFTTTRIYSDGKAGFITYMFDLKYDTVKVTKVPRDIYDPTYTFVRNSPYNYTFSHKVESGTSYSVVVNGKNFLDDTVSFKY